jgi:hypothetical protein
MADPITAVGRIGIITATWRLLTFNATILHLLGLDHQRLTYYHNGTERRLTDVHRHVLANVLA